MSLEFVFKDFVYFGLFLIAGFVIREFIRPLQKWFIPSSVIGGVLALILSQQILGVVEISPSFADYNSIYMRVIMTCVVLGIGVTAKKIKSHLDYTFANVFLYGAQMVFGILLAGLLVNVWTDMPNGWGILGVFSFFGSHGGAAAAGAVLEELGSNGALGIGMVLATGGLVISMTLGMVVVNYGVRKGWATFVKEPKKLPESFYRGPLPLEERESIGATTTTTISVNPIALHVGIIMVSYALGFGIFKVLVGWMPVLGKINAMLYGMVGGLIVWPLMGKLKLQTYFDKKIVDQISSFCLEMLILTSIATLPLDIITKYGVPLFTFIIINCILTILFCVWYFKKTNTEQWFEKCVMVIGTCTGSTPNGFALVRSIDPDSKAVAAEAHGVYNALFWWNNILTPILPAILLASFWGTIGIGLAFVIGASLLSFILFGRKKASA